MTRFATWNVNSLNARQERVEQWLADVQPDIVCMQETKLADEAFPALAFEALGYESAHHGEGRWNGVAILSRVGLADVVDGFADGAEPDARGPPHHGSLRLVSRRQRVRAQRPGARQRPLPVQAALARPARTPTSTPCPPRATRW